ncbi:MAG: tyrosine-type recombinase/integrase [Pseudomonas profundi]|uniref:tyrosine-type recombinase/integrase n=1 Tax=Pseudomonas profundi TaxID=1981513 RepID=UPI0030023A5A
MSEEYIKQLSEFRAWRDEFLPVVEMAIKRVAANDDSASISMEAWVYYQSLLAMPVSRLSKFGDAIWDFNADAPHAARNVKGAKLVIAFSKYKNLNATAILEIKVALYLYLLAPAAVTGDSPGGRKTVKYNTAVAIFECGLRFVDHLYALAAEELGKDYISSKCFGLANFSADNYMQAAESFRYKYSDGISRFFSVLRSSLLKAYIFGEALSYVRVDTLPWSSADEESISIKDQFAISKNHLPNDVFEKLSSYASLLIVDFLDALGLPVQDVGALKRRNVKQFRRSDEFGISSKLMALYTVMRLGAKGYSFSQVVDILGDVAVDVRTTGGYVSRSAVQELAGGLIHDGLRQYLNLINYACCYIVGQYTGMRPSELSELLVESCLVQDGKYWLLESRVLKHQQDERKLFDDRWIAIPIVRDAVEVARVMARYKQSPYLFSSVFTVAPGASCLALESNGMKYQLDAFLAAGLSQEQYENLNFNPYVLRHTLAYQMYRIDLGLPFISHQLKHFGEIVSDYGKKGFSKVTLGYGNIGDMISKGGRHANNPLRKEAEVEAIKDYFDPDGSYAGVNGPEHKARIGSAFKGYMAAGYSKEETFAAMANQHLAIVNVGAGFCYGGKSEEFDDSLPCIGGLRCNPNRCSNSVITKAHAPKWREIYTQNQGLLCDPDYADRYEQIEEVMKEAEGVLRYLGEGIDP